MGRRAFVVVLDACGAGALPDADAYGDGSTNTLAHLAEAVGGLQLPTLGRLGLGSIIPLAGVPPAADPVLHGRLHPLGPGKDSTTGHWELMGVVAAAAPPTYPGGFPPAVVDVVCRVTGRGVLANRPYDGIAAIDDFGAEHLETGRLILYTSQDSVLQLAAHADVLGEAALHAACAAVREQLPADHAVQRVIARPFAGAPGRFERLAGRRDFSLAPPSRSYLDVLAAAGVEVHAVGKVDDLFTGRGIARAHPGPTNAAALASTSALLDDLEEGLVFTNLIETDQVFGHRKDLEGFHGALRDVDRAVAAWLPRVRDGDLLVLTADHGCDMTTPGTDHTREHAPLLAVAPGLRGRHDGPLADVGASVLRWLTGRDEPALPGTPFTQRRPAPCRDDDEGV
jgi:phosphopentomutase